MSHLKKIHILVIPVVLALTISTFIVTPALADDGTPPIDIPTEITTPTVDPEPINAPPIDNTPIDQAQGESAAAPAEEATPVSDLLSQVPEGTELVVMNAEGEAQPLASEEAAQAIEIIDPIWCPTGVAPKALTGGCSDAYPNLGALVGSFAPAKAGVIWIQTGADNSSTNIQINGSGTWASAANFALTLKGGWNGVDKSTVISGFSTFDKSIAIIYWNAPVTLSDITISGAGSAAGANNSALEIVTTGNINLNRVNAITNGGTLNGIYLNNTSSTKSATLTVSNSNILSNASSGLSIHSDGVITLNAVTSDGNGAYGIFLNNQYDNLASPITVTGAHISGNAYSGLIIFSNGPVTLNNLYATYNTGGGNGVYVNNTSSSIASGVVIMNTGIAPNIFYGNDALGLAVYSNGIITAKNLIVTNNNLGGAVINNSTATAPKSVTLAGLLEFNNNGDIGLEIYSKGSVTLGNLTANGNTTSGVNINNTYSGAVASAVKITGNNSFNLNGSGGLWVVSNGVITLNNTTANNNGWVGVFLQNGTGQGIFVTGFLTSMDNASNGLALISTGNITAANLTISNNQGYGVSIDNSAANSPKSVTVTGINIFHNNSFDGLRVTSRGTVTLNNISALSNGYYSQTSGVVISNTYSPTEQMNVTISGYGIFEDNGEYGLKILSYGVVTLSNITANNNGYYLANTVGDGVFVNNRGGITAKPITITGVNSFNENDANGLIALSNGAVEASNLTAIGNNKDGVHISNSNGGGGVQSRVTLSGYGLFESNGITGLYIASNGSVTTNNLNANYNLTYGVYISVIGITTPQSVTLNGNNNFNFNATGGNGGGLKIMADGNIKVNNVTATDNNGFGAWLDNYTNWAIQGFTTYGSITQTGFGNFVNNINSHGLYVHTPGSVFLNRVTAAYNGNTAGDDGIHIIADHNATLTCVTAYHNSDHGLFAYITGKLTLKGLFSYGNGYDEGLTYGTLIRTACP